MTIVLKDFGKIISINISRHGRDIGIYA